MLKDTWMEDTIFQYAEAETMILLRFFLETYAPHDMCYLLVFKVNLPLRNSRRTGPRNQCLSVHLDNVR